MGGIINAIDDQTLHDLAKQVGLALTRQGLMLASAESCTGGWLGQIVTSIPGSSAWYESGFITYTANAKQKMLGISTKTLKEYGEVSEQIAREMAHGVVARSGAQISVSITGIAGPGGASKNKPVGLVYIGIKKGKILIIKENKFKSNNRNLIQKLTVKKVIKIILKHSNFLQKGSNLAI